MARSNVYPAMYIGFTPPRGRQECLDEHRNILEASVHHWESLRAEGVSEAKCAEFVGISRATYYRRRARHKALARGVLPPSKAPRRRNKPHWGEREKQLVLAVRRAHPTWGKAKIAVVIKREHGHDISESMVGRILSFLSQERLITRARSRPQRRRRDFSKGHAQAWKYKEYKEMGLGERVQIDHMSATKNGVGVKHFMAQDRMADRKSKHIHAQIYSRAVFVNAASKFPFKRF